MSRARSIEAINASCLAIDHALRPGVSIWLYIGDFKVATRAAMDPIAFRGSFTWSPGDGLQFRGRRVCCEGIEAPDVASAS